MRMLPVIVVATAALCGSNVTFGQRFLDQLEGVLEAEAERAEAKRAEAEAAEARAGKIAAGSALEPSDVAVPGYLGLIAEERSGAIRVEWVREATAAERAGIQVGDAIRRIGDRDVATLDAMGEALAGRLAGERVMLSIRRGERVLELPVTLGARTNPSLRLKPLAATPPPAPDVRIDALDALVELERLLDKETLPKETAERAVDASRRKRIAELERELGNVKRRIVELERELAELVAE